MSDSGHTTLTELEISAEAQGLKLVIPQNDEVILDLDGEAQVNLPAAYALQKAGWVIYSIHRTVSKRGNRHLYLWLSKDVSPLQRAVVQAALGSDPMREMLSVLKADFLDVGPSVAFEKPQAEKSVSLWRKRRQITKHELSKPEVEL